MNKKTIISIIFACMIIVSGVMYWNYSKDYNHVIKENWKISIPSDSDYSEVYSKDAGSSFNGDGVRYHVFTYENEEPIERCFPGKKIKEKPSMMATIKMQPTNGWMRSMYLQ